MCLPCCYWHLLRCCLCSSHGGTAADGWSPCVLHTCIVCFHASRYLLIPCDRVSSKCIHGNENKVPTLPHRCQCCRIPNMKSIDDGWRKKRGGELFLHADKQVLSFSYFLLTTFHPSYHAWCIFGTCIQKEIKKGIRDTDAG